ncbi:MAG: nitrile hydratase accessory protein [Synechococcaceae cyanobacterium]|jgi:nitrile hydratase accessory protein
MNPVHPDVTTTADVESALAAEALQPLPSKRGEPVFQNSWEAEAYAIGNILVKEGYLSCREWMEFMSAAIRQAQASGDPDCGDTYYLHWCASLESFCFAKQWITPETYQSLLAEWALAISKTPHGVPLSLENAHTSGCSAEIHGTNVSPGHSHAHAHSHQHHRGEGPPEHFWNPAHVTHLKTGSLGV